MPEGKPMPCPNCGAEPGLVTCPACGGVFRKNLAGWTLGLSAAVAACALVVAYAASWWLKGAAVAIALGCGAGFLAIRAALLRAARVRMPDFPWHEGRPPWHVTLWAAGAAALVLASVTVGFVSYDAAGFRTAAPTAGAAPPPAPAQPVKKPLPVGVTFRPSAGGPGQLVYLTGAPGIEPLIVRVTADPPRNGNARAALVPVGRSRVQNVLWAAMELRRLEKEVDEKEELRRLYSADVLVRPGAEAEVVWKGGRGVLVPPGRAVTLTCEGYAPLTTSTTVPPNSPAARRPPTPVGPPRASAEALKELEEVAKQVRQARTTHATTLLLDGKYDDAVREFDAILAEAPGDVYALNGRGYAHAGRGDLARAFADLDESVRVRPEWAPTYRLRGQVLFLRKEYRAALGEYTSAIRLDPRAGVGLLWFVRDPFSAHLERAFVRLELGEFGGAVADCDAELRLNPNSYEAHGLRAAAHQKLGNGAAAKADRDRAVELRDARPKR
jgi:tetratricopeptide (TPR) repeat protein